MESGNSSKFSRLKIGDNQDINILLLGETGVGKSTFINAIANYLHFKSFKKAAKTEELLVLIPTIFTVTDKDMQRVEIKIGSDNNEFQDVGAAGTQGVKTYVFPMGEGKTKLRLIDSPGMGDPRGIQQDHINCENILAYLSQLHELHAVCFLMMTTTRRITVFFEYVVKEILSRLEKSASKNIVFVFTNSRGSNYTPGDSLSSLRVVLDDIKSKPPHVDIPLNDNVFSVDNEAFRYLVAIKKKVEFNEEVEARFVESWSKSSEECWRLISYILGDVSRDGLQPHQLINTMSINEARRMIVQLSHPLAEITQLIYDNLRILERHQAHLAIENQSLDELRKKLYMPVVNLEVTQLTKPVTVCTSTKCAKLVQVGDVRKWHYTQRCHDPCHLTNVDKEIVGHLNLMQCTAMKGTRMCRKCTCDFSVHMHVYYLTKTVADKIVDNNVQVNILQKEEALDESRRLIREIDARKKELEEERSLIISSTAQFAHFLQHNAISPYNDSYKAYIDYLIKREESMGSHADQGTIDNLRQLLQQYVEIKATFEAGLRMDETQSDDAQITAKSVIGSIHKLYKLKHNGMKIRELLKKQKAPRSYEYNQSCEYIHPKSSEPYKPTKGTAADVDKKLKKKSGATTDEDTKNKKKSGSDKGYATADDDRKTKQNTMKGYRPQNYHNRYEPPPPYPGHVKPNKPQHKKKAFDQAAHGADNQYNPPDYHGAHYQGPPPPPHYYPPPGPPGHYGPSGPPGYYGPPGPYPPPSYPYWQQPQNYGPQPPPPPPQYYRAPQHWNDQRPPHYQHQQGPRPYYKYQPQQQGPNQNYRGRPFVKRGGYNNVRSKSQQGKQSSSSSSESD